MDANAQPDPEPVPDLVLHPGDTLTVAPDEDAALHLSGADGHVYAVLELDRGPDPDAFRIGAIRLLSAPGGRLLPVRALAQPQPIAHPHPDSYALPDVPADVAPDALVHAHRHPHHGRLDVIARTGLVVDRYDHTHRHAHTTPRDDRSYHDDHGH
jgi:hypothetical protein